MRKIISFMHISLDGFVAGPNGEMNWIKVNEEIFDFVGERVGKGDTALYGRKTYQMMESYWPTAGDAPDASKHDKEHSAWYKKIHKIVLSKTMKGQILNNTSIISDNLIAEINKVKQKPGSDIAVFGSPSATHALQQHNLIDGYWLFLNPIILGKGIPLFKDIKEQTKLNLLSTHKFSCGVVELSYEMELS
jgi:dihydrofolate reductase